VKCDEFKPNCNRCTSTGRNCDGYNTPVVVKTVSSTPNKTSDMGKSLSLVMRSFRSPLESAEEQETLSFFQTYAAVELCGYFSSSFWLREILQAAQTYPEIRYGVTALGAMHRRYIAGDSSSIPENTSDKHLRFALQQSNYAIHELLKKPRKRSKADMIAVMTCCILFNALACLQGHQQDALNHLRSGIKLLNEYDYDAYASTDKANTQPISLDSIRTIILTLDTQARGIMSGHDLRHWEPQPKRSEYTNKLIDTTTSFASQTSAQRYIEATFSDLMAFFPDLSVRSLSEMGDVEAVSRRLQYQCRNANEMLAEFLATDSSRNSAHCNKGNDQRIIALRLMQTVLDVFAGSLKQNALFLGAGYAGSPIPFNDEENLFSTILELTTQLMEPKASFNGRSLPQETHRPVFSSTTGVVLALWVAATQAPDYDIRRKAINMLLEHPRREGVWDGPLAGKIALEKLALEEESTREQLGLAHVDPPFVITHESHVPLNLRVRDINIKYTDLREATVEYRNRGHIAKDEPGWVRCISW
jgi:hypothetical protein